MDINLIFIPLLGFLIGLFVSIFGGGGGGLYVPILILFFGIPTQTAVATSLASVLPTTAAGAYSHYNEGNVDIRTGVILGIGGIIGTLIGVYVANLIPPLILKKLLGIFSLIMIIPILRSFLKRRQQTQKNKETEIKKGTVNLTGYKRIIASLFGIASGLMAGIFGLSGTPPVNMGLYILGLPAMMVVGTSVFVLIFNSVTGIGGYFFLGRLDVMLIILLGSGAVVGAFLGPKLLRKISPETFEKIYGPLIVSISLILGLSLILT
jgi:uncharacterized membrane protein YfcA